MTFIHNHASAIVACDFFTSVTATFQVLYGRFFSVLSETGYAGAVCVEVEDRAYEGSLENRKASLTHSARWIIYEDGSL